MALIRANKKSQVIFDFDNGQGMSIIWGYGTYTEKARPIDTTLEYKHDFDMENPIENPEVEILPYGDVFTDWLNKKYDGYGSDPIGYIPVADLPEIISKAASIKVSEVKNG